jgi:hypothetical protein
MDEILRIVPMVLYFIIGLISLRMAIKNFFSKSFLPFHEKTAGKTWNEIEDPLKLLILTFMRLTGLGFLVLAILLLVCPVVNYYHPTAFYNYLIPVIALIYCSGLFILNYLLFKRTNAKTPWKGSLYAMFLITAGIIISILN